jgi:hypothetical protein
MSAARFWHRARSAITGRFVRFTTALLHPKTTIAEAIRRRRKRKAWRE